MLVARGWGKAENGELELNRYKVSVREDEKFLKMDRNRDDLPTKYMYLMLLNIMAKFILWVIFTTIFKFS